MLSGPIARVRDLINVVYREAIKFGAVGAIAFVLDVGLFNLLTTALWPGTGSPPLDGHEKIAKITSASVAILWAWLGNRYWTFRHRRQATPLRELLLFVAMNLIGLVIAVACLAISHDLLGFTSPLADNISGNVIGIGLGTVFRFWAYRRFVFNEFLDEAGPGPARPTAPQVRTVTGLPPEASTPTPSGVSAGRRPASGGH
ncbi:MAG: GtrA family protein [Kineosporiaceae bacterium]|nr:GtrA family protein [Kineosporiaceae bacterium]